MPIPTKLRDFDDLPKRRLLNSPRDLGTLIRSKRKRQKLTQQDLADGLGVTRQLIGELENGRPSIRFEVALLAARQLGIDLFAEERV